MCEQDCEQGDVKEVFGLVACDGRHFPLFNNHSMIVVGCCRLSGSTCSTMFNRVLAALVWLSTAINILVFGVFLVKLTTP